MLHHTHGIMYHPRESRNISHAAYKKIAYASGIKIFPSKLSECEIYPTDGKSLVSIFPLLSIVARGNLKYMC